jgi:hypothetical protein
MQTTPQRSQLFVASCLALLVTSLSFGIRAGILGQLGTEFHLNAEELGTIAATAFWGFPLAVVIGGICCADTNAANFVETNELGV